MIFTFLKLMSTFVKSCFRLLWILLVNCPTCSVVCRKRIDVGGKRLDFLNEVVCYIYLLFYSERQVVV